MHDNDLLMEKADELVREVRQLAAAKPADRAALRHSLGRLPKEVGLDVHRIVVKHLPHQQVDDATERAFYAVPAFIAAQPRHGRDDDAAAGAETPGPASHQNFGESLARAASGSGPNASDRMDARLQLIARQDLDGLHRQLPRLVLHLRADLVRIDWPLLIRDLARWGRDPKQVAKEWMQSYYRTSERLIAEKKHDDDAAARSGRGNEEK